MGRTESSLCGTYKGEREADHDGHTKRSGKEAQKFRKCQDTGGAGAVFQPACTKAVSYFDWVIPSLIRHHSFAEILSNYQIPAPFTNPLYDTDVEFRIRLVMPEELAFGKEMVKDAGNAFELEELRNWDVKATYDEKMRSSLRNTYEYPYQSSAVQKIKI